MSHSIPISKAIFEVPEMGPEEEAAFAHIDGLRGELRFYVAEPRRWVGAMRKVLAARAIQGSNSIEGYDVSVEDAVAAIDGDEPSSTADEESWQAVAGYRRAMTYVLQLASDAHFSYTPSLLRSLHFMMTEHDLEASPGLWRPGPIWVRNEATTGIVYSAPESEAVPELVEALVEQLGQASDVRSLVRAAMAHLNLVMIHPFRDGNGRMARCLQTLVLAREGILAPEFCSIEEYLGRNTQSYYDILAKVGRGSWHPENDARSWVRYCLQAHYVQAASVLRRVQESQRIWAYLEERVSEAGVAPRAMEALFDATLGLRVQNASYRANLFRSGEEISNQTATNDLRGLVDAQLLVKHGEKRGAYYRAARSLVGFRLNLINGRAPIDTDQLFSPIAGS